MVGKQLFTLENIGNFLSKLAEKSESVYWLSSHDFEKIEYISPSYEKIWGRSRNELYKHPEKWITFLHPDDAISNHPIQNMIEKIQHLGPAARYDESYRIVKPNGEVRWIMDRGFPIYDSLGNCQGITGVAVDVTKEKLREIMLNEAKEKAELATKVKTEFLMNMQHDFRTPFSGILSMAEILLSQEKNKSKKENLTIIVDSAKNLLQQLNELFEFISLENNTLPTIDKHFDLYQLFFEMEPLMRPAVLSKKLNWSIHWQEDMPHYFIGDRVKTQKILMNLLSNAIKFTDHGQVVLTASVEKIIDNTLIAKFTIEDTGVGIPKDKSDIIFQRFTRLAPSYNGIHQGKGYGLRIVKRFLDDLDGEVHIQSTIGKGTVFSILIPYKIPYLNSTKPI